MSRRDDTAPLPTPDDLRTEPEPARVADTPDARADEPKPRADEPTLENTTTPIRGSEPPVVAAKPAGTTEDVPVADLLRGIEAARAEAPPSKPVPRASPEALAAGTASASHEPIAPRARYPTDPAIDSIQINVTQPMADPDERPASIPDVEPPAPVGSDPPAAEAAAAALPEPASASAVVAEAEAAPAPALAPPPPRKRYEAKTMRTRAKRPMPVGMIAAAGGLLALCALALVILAMRDPEVDPRVPSSTSSAARPRTAQTIVDTNPTTMPGVVQSAAPEASDRARSATWVTASGSPTGAATVVAPPSAAAATATTTTATTATTATTTAATAASAKPRPAASGGGGTGGGTGGGGGKGGGGGTGGGSGGSGDPDLIQFQPTRK